ncbi:hypothetical protein [Asanoa siamensis]|nr:hypothetical protein [Asanoa siamensis]
MAAGRIAGACAAAVLIAALSACWPVRLGVTGVSVDERGQPTAEIVWCGDNRPEVVVLWALTDATLSRTELDTHLRHATVPNDGTWPATAPVGEQVAELGALGLPYRMYGVDEDSAFTTEAVHFDLSELPALPPDTILITEWRNDRYVQRTVTRAEFARLADGLC